MSSDSLTPRITDGTANSAWRTTGLLAAAAGLALGAVYLTRPAAPVVALIAEQGTALAPDLTSPLAIAALEVISFDEQAVRVRAFKLESDGKSWRIPSAFNYLADAQEGVAKAASAFTGVVRERFVSDNKADFARYGVIDPTDETSLSSGGRGTRITFKDAAGRALVDLILGKPVGAESAGAAGSKRFYVRDAGKSRIFTAALDGGFSTRFADWVETDLLKLKTDEIRGLEIDRYSIDEQQGRIVNPTTLKITRARQDLAAITPPQIPGEPPVPPPVAAWTGWQVASDPAPELAAGTQLNADGTGPDQRIDSDRMDAALMALTQLRIVGVQPKPANLVKALSKAESQVNLEMGDQLSLRKHGFYVAPQLGLVANEGSMTVLTDDGVIYQIMLGELASEADAAAAGGQVGGQPSAAEVPAASAPAVTAPDSSITANADGTAPTPATSTSATSPATPAEPKSDARYVMVIANFDPTLIRAPGKPAQLVELENREALEQAALSDELKARLAAARGSYQSLVDAHQSKLDAGKKRAEDLAARFAQWYYLVDLKSLDTIRPMRDQVVIKVVDKALPGFPAPGQMLPGQTPAGDAQPFPPTPLQ